MKTITKFQNGRKYYPSEKRILFLILERNGKELKVARIRQNDIEHFSVTANLTADGKGAYEYFDYDDVRIPATNLLPIGRPVSTLSPERQKVIMNAVMRDAEHRKANNVDSADVLTEQTTDADGKVSISNHASHCRVEIKEQG